MAEIVYKEESYKIIGACFEVYKRLRFYRAGLSGMSESGVLTSKYPLRF